MFRLSLHRGGEYSAGFHLLFLFNPSCLQVCVQPKGPVLQFFKGFLLLLFRQKVLDCIFQSLVKVWDQRITIYLDVLAVACKMCMVLGHRRGLSEVIQSQDGVSLEIQVFEQGSQCINQCLEGGQFLWERAIGIEEISINQWLHSTVWRSI